MKNDNRVIVTVTNRTIVRAILWIVATIILFHFFGRVSHILTLIFISFFLALAINPIVSWMSHRLSIKSRAGATGAAYIVVIAVVAVLLALIVPPLVTQTRDFINTVPARVENFQGQDNSFSRAVKRYNLNDKLSQGARDFTSHYSDFGTTILNTGRRIAGTIVSIVAVLVLTFMMLVEGPAWLETYFNALHSKKRAHQKLLATKMYKSVANFVNGQVLLAVVAGVFALIALEISSQLLDVNINPPALAGIVTMFGIIPLFGNPIAATLVVLICLLSSPALALIMLVYFIVYFFIENHTFQPYLQSRLSELTPLTVFVAALLGIGFAGFIGALVAIPAASTIKILLKDYYEHRRNEQSTAT